MQQVGHYMRQASAARTLAESAESDLLRSQFEGIAEGWEKLARERLAFIQSKLDAAHAKLDTKLPSRVVDSIRAGRMDA